jgi:hypothetical protein
VAEDVSEEDRDELELWELDLFGDLIDLFDDVLDFFAGVLFFVDFWVSLWLFSLICCMFFNWAAN